MDIPSLSDGNGPLGNEPATNQKPKRRPGRPKKSEAVLAVTDCSGGALSGSPDPPGFNGPNDSPGLNGPNDPPGLNGPNDHTPPPGGLNGPNDPTTPPPPGGADKVLTGGGSSSGLIDLTSPGGGNDEPTTQATTSGEEIIIVSELLNYIQHKINTTGDKEEIMDICLSFYTVDEINSSLELLKKIVEDPIFKFPTRKRIRTHTNNGNEKSKLDLKEIVECMYVLDSHVKIPTFVSRNLDRVPDMTPTATEYYRLNRRIQDLEFNLTGAHSVRETMSKIDNTIKAFLNSVQKLETLQPPCIQKSTCPPTPPSIQTEPLKSQFTRMNSLKNTVLPTSFIEFVPQKDPKNYFSMSNDNNNITTQPPKPEQSSILNKTMNHHQNFYQAQNKTQDLSQQRNGNFQQFQSTRRSQQQIQQTRQQQIHQTRQPQQHSACSSITANHYT